MRKASRFFRNKPRDRNGVITHPLNNSLNSEDYFNEFFALFIVSPHLEIQMLPNHEPFKILSTWNAMLSKYTPLKRDSIVIDEPILSYQRNVYLKRHEEAIVEDAFILELLYEEAKVNILSGRYPYHDYELLASIQAAIELGPFQSRVHCSSYFKLKDYIFLPIHYRQLLKKYSNQGSISKLIRRRLNPTTVSSSTNGHNNRVHPPPSASSLFNNHPRSRSSIESSSNQSHNQSNNAKDSLSRFNNDSSLTQSSPYARIVELFKSIYENSNHHPSRIELIRNYLSKMWQLPFYGSAFFIGQIELCTESRIQRVILPKLDKPIYVGVNYEGIHLINKTSCTHLLSLAFDEFKYNLGHPHHELDQSRPSCNLIQCLFIQVTIKDSVQTLQQQPPSSRNSGLNQPQQRARGKECKIFQIFSKSSPLIGSLIKHFSSQVHLSDIPDSGSFREDLVTNTKPIDKSLIKPLEKICCATFNAKGECINYQGSINVLT